jgi:predicted GH43/DUF377 family glycosyl hydrolase
MAVKEDHTYLTWKRDPDNPVFPVVHGTWKHAWTANPDLLLIRDSYFLYYRGQGTDGKDRIGVMTVHKEKFDGKHFDDYKKNPIIDVGPPGSFDSKYVLDPAALYIDGKIMLYYSGISGTQQEGEHPDSIGLAISSDGFHFTKYDKNPVFVGRSPEMIYKDGKFYLIYLKCAHRGYFINDPFYIHLAISEDGYHFEEYGTKPVLPPGNVGEWDIYHTTPRILFEDGIYFMIYAGDDTHFDYSKNLGIAASRDLIHWTKYSGNPIYPRGKDGAWDEGGIWYSTFVRVKNTYYMWYEGYGYGVRRDESFDVEGYSQIGLATMTGVRLKDLFPEL